MREAADKRPAQYSQQRKQEEFIDLAAQPDTQYCLLVKKHAKYHT